MSSEEKAALRLGAGARAAGGRRMAQACAAGLRPQGGGWLKPVRLG
jgi:hypothetical protein